MAKYTPPVQSKIGQIIDVIVLMVLAIGSLYIPLKLGLSGSAKVTTVVENPTWESLGQTPAMVAQWTKLGFTDPASAHDLITTRFDYSFSWLNLVIMAVVLIGYFFMLIKLSDKEYRDVISEKFGGK
jgi:succinate dehydrogenase hydrophobic anchor subunit